MNRNLTSWIVLPAMAALLAGCATARAGETYWFVRAIHPEGRTLEVKAIDPDGKKTYDVKAIEEPGNLHVMDVKAFVDGKVLPVKVLVSDDAYAPVKAIGEHGEIYGIKALTPDGRRLDVKGVSHSGNILHIKAIGPDGSFYGVKAISPSGHLHDVKGVKMTPDKVECKVNGVDVHAHVKALPPAGVGSGEFKWHVKAIDPRGQFLDVKAVDKSGKRNDVKAFEESGNLHLMDIKAIVDGKKLPVKLVMGDKKIPALKAILPDGTTMEIKAFTPHGQTMEVQGVRRNGNIYHIKAIGPGGVMYGVKAISPSGQLHDVKGVKMVKGPVEGTVSGVEFIAHVKALPQVPEPTE